MLNGTTEDPRADLQGSPLRKYDIKSDLQGSPLRKYDIHSDLQNSPLRKYDMNFSGKEANTTLNQVEKSIPKGYPKDGIFPKFKDKKKDWKVPYNNNK